MRKKFDCPYTFFLTAEQASRLQARIVADPLCGSASEYVRRLIVAHLDQVAPALVQPAAPSQGPFAAVEQLKRLGGG